MTKLNQLTIKEMPFYEQYLKTHFVRLEFFIDGKSLFKQLTKAGEDCKNKFGVFSLDSKNPNYNAYHNAMIDGFLGKAPPKLDGSYADVLFLQHRIGFYECGDCACLSCGVMTAKLAVDNDAVTWCNFAFINDYASYDSDYQDFHFTFDKKAYEKLFHDLYL